MKVGNEELRIYNWWQAICRGANNWKD